MVKIEFPDYNFKVKELNGVRMIFDDIRKLWLKVSPEEWVRQNFVRYLVDVKKYPSSLIALEKQIRVGELTKRFDILVYNSSHRPWMMVECKSTAIPLTEEVLNQVLRYNISVPVQFLVITNGNWCMVFEKRNMQLVPLQAMPEYQL